MSVIETDNTSSVNTDYMSCEGKYTSGVYPKREVTIVRGQGAYLWDSNGNKYIDCVAGQGVANLGHCHPQIAAAVSQQSQTLISCPEIFYNDVRARFLEKLATVIPSSLDRIYLCNSGAESIEAAIKFARISTGKKEIIATMRGFHGRTMGALSATWEPKYRKPFQPLLEHVKHVPYGNIEKILETISDETSAILIEAVQGEGGVRPGNREFFTQLRTICNDKGLLLIVDEIQTGFGRTGKWFACEHFGIQPDIMCMGKAIAGGLPMGATAFSQRVENISSGIHGSTFGGNPLASAAGLAAIEAYKSEQLVERTALMSEKIQDDLQKISQLPTVREVRNLGLMIGIELKTRVTPVLKQLMLEKNILALPAGPTVLRLLPPLVISEEDLKTVFQEVYHVLENITMPKRGRS